MKAFRHLGHKGLLGSLHILVGPSSELTLLPHVLREGEQ